MSSSEVVVTPIAETIISSPKGREEAKYHFATHGYWQFVKSDTKPDPQLPEDSPLRLISTGAFSRGDQPHQNRKGFLLYDPTRVEVSVKYFMGDASQKAEELALAKDGWEVVWPYGFDRIVA